MRDLRSKRGRKLQRDMKEHAMRIKQWVKQANFLFDLRLGKNARAEATHSVSNRHNNDLGSVGEGVHDVRKRPKMTLERSGRVSQLDEVIEAWPQLDPTVRRVIVGIVRDGRG